MLYTVNVKMGYDDEMNIKENDILYKLLHELDLKSAYNILKKYDRKGFEVFPSKYPPLTGCSNKTSRISPKKRSINFFLE